MPSDDGTIDGGRRMAEGATHSWPYTKRIYSPGMFVDKSQFTVIKVRPAHRVSTWPFAPVPGLSHVCPLHPHAALSRLPSTADYISTRGGNGANSRLVLRAQVRDASRGIRTSRTLPRSKSRRMRQFVGFELHVLRSPAHGKGGRGF
jgi:hypothetical protein